MSRKRENIQILINQYSTVLCVQLKTENTIKITVWTVIKVKRNQESSIEWNRRKIHSAMNDSRSMEHSIFLMRYYTWKGNGINHWCAECNPEAYSENYSVRYFEYIGCFIFLKTQLDASYSQFDTKNERVNKHWQYVEDLELSYTAFGDVEWFSCLK